MTTPRFFSIGMSSVPYIFSVPYVFNPMALLFTWDIGQFITVDTPAYVACYFFLVILPFVVPGIGIILSRYTVRLPW